MADVLDGDPAVTDSEETVRHGGGRLRVEVVSSQEGFREVREEWNGLLEQSPLESPFLRHEWFEAAWKWHGPPDRPLILLVRRNGVLVGACPLILRHRQYRPFGIKSLEFLTVPDTQECELICHPPGMRLEVLAAIAEWIKKQRRQWDLLYLGQFSSRSDTLERLAGFFGRDWYTTENPLESLNYFLPTPGNWEEYYQGLARKLKKNNNWVANRLRKAGEVEIEWHTPGAGDYDSLYQAVGVSAKSWKASIKGSLDHPGPHAFIRRLSEHAWREGWFSVWLLKLNGRAIAMEYQLVYRGKAYALRGDFDARYGEISPGSHLNHQLLRRFFEEPAVDTYYLGPGTNDYKLRWTERYEEQKAITIYGKTPRARGLKAFKKIKNRLARGAGKEGGFRPPGK
ncbi:MAG TPA: GNAT family N-acetyltransferase [Gammaproteobacteria bacterium]|nr:GNAT family N-acetyltransferase [Gammaproteobacteria bacterium]